VTPADDLDDRNFHSVYVALHHDTPVAEGPPIAAGFFHRERYTTKDFAQDAIDDHLHTSYVNHYPQHFVDVFPVKL